MSAEVIPAVSESAVLESVAVARSHGEKFFEQIIWQIENETWTVIGYSDWDSMRAAKYGDMGVVVPRADRPELVSRMRAKGLTQSQIAGTLGVSVGTVNAEVKFNIENDTVPPTIVNNRGQERPATYAPRPATVTVDDMTVDVATGELIEPTVTEHTFTEKVKTTTRPEPKPVPRGDDANKLNAIQASKAIGNALESLQYLNYDKARHGIVTDWWPLGNHEVPPEQSAYFTPAELRKLAQGLIRTAELLEAQRVD